MGDMDPEMLQAMLRMIMGGQENETEEDLIRRQYDQAGKLRGGKLEMRDAGRVQVAPSFLELAGNLAQDYAGKKKESITDERVGKLGQKKGADNQKIFEMLMAMQRPAPTVSPGAVQGLGRGDGINLGMPYGEGMKIPQGMQAGMTPPFGM